MNGTFQYSKGFRLVVDETGCWEKGCTYFAKVFDKSRFEVVSLSTYNDLARWFLERKEKVTAPEKGRFIFENFDPATIKK